MRLWQADRQMIWLSPQCMNKWVMATFLRRYVAVTNHTHKSSCMPTVLQRSMQHSILPMQIQHAPPHTSTSHIDFTLTMIDSSSSLLAWFTLSGAFVFNSRQKYLRLALTLWRRHDHFLPFQKPPAWPAKSRHSRATLELSQLSEQLSLLAPPRPSCVWDGLKTPRESRESKTELNQAWKS